MLGIALLKRQLMYGSAVVVVSILLVYFRVVHFDFVWDDTSVLWDSGSYHGENIFRSIWSNFPISENYFRPFVVVTFALDMLLFDNMPGPMHLHNLFVHIGSSLLVGALVVQFLIRFRRLDSIVLPAFAALIFGLHPMVMEPAAWVSGRFDAYVTFWLLLLLNVDLILERLPWRIVSAFFLFLLAALSKEMAAVFPLVYILVRMAYLPEQGLLISRIRALKEDGSVAVFAALVLSGFTYLFLRFSALGYLQQPFDQGIVRAHFGSLLQHALLVGKTAAVYLLYSVAGGAFTSPTHYQVFPIPYDDPGAWCGSLLVVLMLIASMAWLHKGNRLGYVIPVFIVCLLPVLNILFWPNTEDIVQERFMSFPLALLTALLIIVLAQISQQRRQIVLVLLSAFLLVNGAITSVTMPIWRNHMSLWSWAVYRAPQSPYATTNLAVSYRINGDQVNAKKYAEIANLLDPSLLMGDFTLASIAVDEKNYSEAIHIADRYIGRDGITENQRGDLLYIKANALHELQRDDEAISILENLVKISPQNAHFSMSLGGILSAKGQKERAFACWVMALKQMPASQARLKFSDGQVHIDDLEKMVGDATCVPLAR